MILLLLPPSFLPQARQYPEALKVAQEALDALPAEHFVASKYRLLYT